MRSTVEILDVLDRQLRSKADKLGLTFKEALNRVIAAGLPELDEPSKSSRKKYKVHAKACGIRAGVDLLHLNRLADEIEDEERFDRK